MLLVTFFSLPVLDSIKLMFVISHNMRGYKHHMRVSYDVHVDGSWGGGAHGGIFWTVWSKTCRPRGTDQIADGQTVGVIKSFHAGLEGS
jgi:hypothetical protein